jgi:hypothetical protein
VLRVKVAVTVFAASTTRVQDVPTTVVHPLQLVKVEPVAGAAVRTTLVPLAMLALQVAPQAIPAGVEVTVPLPVPGLLTVTV